MPGGNDRFLRFCGVWPRDLPARQIRQPNKPLFSHAEGLAEGWCSQPNAPLSIPIRSTPLPALATACLHARREPLGARRRPSLPLPPPRATSAPGAGSPCLDARGRPPPRPPPAALTLLPALGRRLPRRPPRPPARARFLSKWGWLCPDWRSPSSSSSLRRSSRRRRGRRRPSCRTPSTPTASPSSRKPTARKSSLPDTNDFVPLSFACLLLVWKSGGRIRVRVWWARAAERHHAHGSDPRKFRV
jgi:hypothetical protein